MCGIKCVSKNRRKRRRKESETDNNFWIPILEKNLKFRFTKRMIRLSGWKEEKEGREGGREGDRKGNWQNPFTSFGIFTFSCRETCRNERNPKRETPYFHRSNLRDFSRVPYPPLSLSLSQFLSPFLSVFAEECYVGIQSLERYNRSSILLAFEKNTRF